MRLSVEDYNYLPILKNITYNLRVTPNRNWSHLEGNTNFRAIQKLVERADVARNIDLRIHPYLLERFQQWFDKRQELIDIKSQSDAPDIHDLYFKAKELWEYQRVDIKFAYAAKHALILEPPGAGKTAIACATYDIAREFNGVKKLLIICPAAVRTHWKNNLLRWTKIPRYQRPDGSFNTKNVIIADDASLSTKLLKVMAFLSPGFEGALIINWEGIKLQVIKDVLLEATQANKIDFIIADEIHRARNLQHSKQAKIFVDLHAEYQLGLTGTPVVNRAEDFFPLVNWEYPDQYDNFQIFKEDFVDDPKAKYAHAVRNDGMSETMKLELDNIMIRHEADYIDRYLGLQPPLHQPETVELYPKQRRLYDSMRDELIAELENGDIIETTLRIAQINRLKQIAVSPASIPAVMDLHHGHQISVETYKMDESAKFDWIEEFVEENPDEKVLIFSQFEAAAALLQHRFMQLPRYKNKEQGIIYACSKKTIWDKSYTDLDVLQDAWTMDEKIKLWLGTLKTGGEGLNLQAAHICILVDLWWNPATIEQAWKRLHRPGQTKPVRIIYLYAEDTIEQEIKEMIDNKQEVSDLMIRTDVLLKLLKKDQERGKAA